MLQYVTVLGNYCIAVSSPATEDEYAGMADMNVFLCLRDNKPCSFKEATHVVRLMTNGYVYWVDNPEEVSQVMAYVRAFALGYEAAMDDANLGGHRFQIVPKRVIVERKG